MTRSAECPIAIAKEYRHIVRAAVCHHQVEEAVAVDILQHDSFWVEADKCLGGSRTSRSPVTQEYRDRVDVRIGDDQVDMHIIIEGSEPPA